MQSYIQHILDESVQSGRELGLQCAIGDVRSGISASCSAGWADGSRLRRMSAETLIPVFSTGKVLLTIAALRILGRHGIAYETPLCRIWPEFNGSGREDITFWHVLTHSSGMFCMPHADTPEQFVDWQYMCSALCRMRPSFNPGSRTKYQAFTYSWLLGNPLCILTGKPLRQVIQEEVLAPAGVSESECSFGVPEASRRNEVAELVRTPDFLPPLPPRGSFYNPTERMMTNPLILSACLPAFNCCATARALTQIGVALMRDENPLLPPDVLQDAAQLHRPEGEPVPREPGRWDVFGYGFILYERQLGRRGVFGHGGYAGAELIMDLPRRQVFAFSRNLLTLNNEAKERLLRWWSESDVS